MYPTYTLTGLVALASSTNALILPRIDPYVGDLRTFGQVDCSADNQGVGTFTQSMTGICNKWPETFSSLYIHITDGWVFHAYSTSNCSDNGTAIEGSIPKDGSPIVCNNSPSEWVAYTVDRLPAPSPLPSSSPPSSPSNGSPPNGSPPHGPPYGGPPFRPPFGESTENDTS
ncbi:hypothetical protein F4781DRAFT_289304 [Annulohypoxylon bovei var. microspora]|nr:hypothetical protein F4781DRAFT_289304 [Annulohypoxylon bovei var. microspora]